MHKDILFLVLAYKQRFINLDEFSRIGEEWRKNSNANLFRILIAKLSSTEFNTLREALISTLARFKDDEERAVRSVGGMGIVTKHFGPWNTLHRVSEENWGVQTIIDEDSNFDEVRNSLLGEGMALLPSLDEPDDKTVDFVLPSGTQPPSWSNDEEDETRTFKKVPPPSGDDDGTRNYKKVQSPPVDDDDETSDFKLAGTHGDHGMEAGDFAREHDGHSIFDETRDYQKPYPPAPVDSQGEIIITRMGPDSAAHDLSGNVPWVIESDGFSNLIEEMDERIHISVPDQELLEARPRSPVPKTGFPPPPPPPPDLADPLEGLGISHEEPGRYRIKGEKYRGSIGRILVGIDTHIGREVAIKELLFPGQSSDEGGMINGKKPLRDSANIRFLREARLAGQLQHPSIIPIYEIGQRPDGSLYYTMRHVGGVNLGDAILNAKSLAGRLKLLPHFLDLCNAIAFAHSQGVIHRDIKPDNIIIGEFGETVVLDWGLAKMRTGDDPGGRRIAAEIQQLTQGDTHTIAGQALGTPAYMPPEQARGEVDRIDEQSDVYSLGVVLFEILVGSPPWSGNIYDVLHKVVHEPVPDILTLQPAAPRDLAKLAALALQKNKAQRLRSVNDLVEGLEEYLSGEKSGGQRPLELFASLFANRRKGVIAGIGIVLFFLVLTGSLLFAWHGQSARADQLEEKVGSAEVQRLQSHFLMSQAFNEIATRMENDSQFAAAQIYASSSLVHNPTHPRSPWYVKGFEKEHHQAYQLRTEAFSRLYRTNFNLSLALESIHRFNSSLVKLAVSPVKNVAAVGCYDNTIHIVDLSGKTPAKVLEGHRDRIHGLDFSPDGRQVVSAAYDRTVIIWNIAEGKAAHVLEGHGERVIDVVWSPDGKTIASLDYAGVIFLWDAEEKKKTATINAKKYYKIFRIQFTSDGKSLVAGAREDNILLFDLGKRKVLKRRIKGFFQRINAIAVSPDGRRVVAAGDSNTVMMWDLASGKMVHSLQGHTATVLDVKISSDGRLLYTGGHDNSIRVWDMETGACLYAIHSHKERVYGLAQLSDNVRIATASWDNTVKVWKMQRSTILPVLKGHTDYIVKAAFSPDGRRIASSSWDRSVRIWDSRLGTSIVNFKGFADKVWAVAWSPDGKKLASSCWDGSITILDAENGQLIKRLEGHKDRVFGIAWSADGGKLISSSKDNTVIIWDVNWGRPIHTLKGHGDSVRNVAVSPRGGLIASVSKDQTIILWTLSGQKVRTITGHKELVSGVDFSSDGTLLATSSKDKKVMLFQTATGKKIREFTGHEAWVNSVRFSGDDRYLATASDDHTVRVWEAATGRMLLVLHSARESISAEFSPDGKTLLYGDGNDVRMVPVDFSLVDKDPRELLEAAQKRSGLKLDGVVIEVVEPDALVK